MRRFLLLLLFVAMLIAGVFATTPLGFVLTQSGARDLGVGWAKVDGTLLNGRISGLYVGTQPIGDFSLELRPLSLLSLKPTYDVRWGGAGGQGTAVLTLSRSALNATQIRMRQQIASLEGLDPAVRAMNGSISVNEGAVRLTQQGCESASGTLSTDTLSTLAAQYGREFGQVSGPIACDSGAFVLNMQGESQAEDRVFVDARASITGHGSFSTRVQTQDAQIIIALNQLGFQRENGEFVYRQSRGLGIQ